MSECRLPSGRAVLDCEDEMSLPKGESRGTLLLALHEAMECLRNSNMTRAELMQQVEGLERELEIQRMANGKLNEFAIELKQRLAAQPVAVELEVSNGALLEAAVDAWQSQTSMDWSSDGLQAAVDAVQALLTAPPARPVVVEHARSPHEMGYCCYGGNKTRRDCESCAKWSPVATITAPPAQARAVPDECSATGQSCSYDRVGPNDEVQCLYCGAAPAAQEQEKGS